nr:hypothetical protein [uncultured Porphyromonas sp.]
MMPIRYRSKYFFVLFILCCITSCYFSRPAMRTRVELQPYLSLAQFVDELRRHAEEHRDEYLAVQWISADSFLRVVFVPEVGVRSSYWELSDAVRDTLSLRSIWSLLDPQFVVDGIAYLQDYDSVWYDCRLGGSLEHDPLPLDPRDPMIPILSSTRPVYTLYIDGWDGSFLVVYDLESKELKAYKTKGLFGKVPADAVLEVPVDSVLEESYLKGIRRGDVPRGIDLRKQPKYPNPICE